MEILIDSLFNISWLKSSIELTADWSVIEHSEMTCASLIFQPQSHYICVKGTAVVSTFDLKSTRDLFCITSYTAGFRDHIAPTTHSHWPLPDNTREIWSFPMFSSKKVILLSYDHPEPCLSTRWTDFEADSYTYLCIPVMIWRQKLNVGVFVSLLTVQGTVYIINADGFVILHPSFASNGFKPNSPALKCILQHIRDCETQLELER